MGENIAHAHREFFYHFYKNKKILFIIPYNIIILKEYNINIIISSLDTILLNWI